MKQDDYGEGFQLEADNKIAVTYLHPMIALEFSIAGTFQRLTLEKHTARALLADLANVLR